MTICRPGLGITNENIIFAFREVLQCMASSKFTELEIDVTELMKFDKSAKFVKKLLFCFFDYRSVAYSDVATRHQSSKDNKKSEWKMLTKQDRQQGYFKLKILLYP